MKKLKKYYFNENVAKEIGVEEAIMLHNIDYWIKHNSSTCSVNHLHEGKYWMYNSVSSFAEQYTFWTFNQIRRILNNLEKNGFIEKGQFNKWRPDKTKWYTLAPKGIAILENNSLIV